jgi:putative FmdB family regulatory protein
MPTYEYRCPKGHDFELFQRMSDEPRAVCPECGGESERLISGGAGFLFKGDGFYITDYRSESYKKGASDEKSADSTEQKKPPGGEKDPATPRKSQRSGGSPSGSSTGGDSQGESQRSRGSPSGSSTGGDSSGEGS